MTAIKSIIGSFLFLTFLVASCLNAQFDDEPLEVNLATENMLIPFYILPFTQETSDFSLTYLKQLENVLNFDLSYNGLTTVIKQQNDWNSWDCEQSRYITNWQNANLAYVIKGKVSQRSFSLSILDVGKKMIKTTDPIVLTGQLNEDRRAIHRLADALHKTFLGTDGIASTHILYTVRHQTGKDSTKWTSEVWEADYDGANPRQLTKENAYCITPVYLPPKAGYTSGGFLYVSYQIGQPKVYMASLKEGVGRRLLYLRGNQLMPTLALKRDKIAFISDITGNPDLFLQPFNPETGTVGKPQQIFSAKQATQGSPTFSPDGKKIAFVSNKDGSPKIYVIDVPRPGASLNSIHATLISKRNRENSAPAWSPDGTKLAYCSRSNQDRQIWIYDFETNQEKQLTQGAGHKENPSWAPNSQCLIYNSSNQDTSELFLINIHQGESVQISKGRGEKRFPNWEPRSNSSL